MLYQQPQTGPLQIDWANPLSRGLTAAAGVDLIDYVYKTAPIVVGTPVKSVNKYGRVWNFTSSTAHTDYLKYTTSTVYDDIFKSTPGTIHIQFSTSSVADVYGLIGKCDNNISGGWKVRVHTGSSFIEFTRVNSGSNTSIQFTFNAVANTQYFLSIVQNSAATPATTGNVDMYLDGVAQAVTISSGGSGSNGTDAGQDLILGANVFNETHGLNGDISFFSLYRRAQTAAEVKAVYDNIWQVFLDQDEEEYISFVQSGGPQSYSYSATGGALFSGSVPILKQAFKTPTGGMTFLGTGTPLRGAARGTSGGLTFGGASTILRGLVRSGIGGVVFAGAAALSFFNGVQSYSYTAVGGILFSGAATKLRSLLRTASGGILFGGTATIIETPDPNPTTGHNHKRSRRPRTRPNY